jgi:hypothetical protein
LFYNINTFLVKFLKSDRNCKTDILFVHIASDVTDHVITDAAMHVIWARGQVAGNIHHNPSSGLEHSSSSPSIPNYYYTDELKYHGREITGSSYGHRGSLTLNFFGKFESFLCNQMNAS